MQPPNTCEILVVGAGPAGSRAAAVAAARGADTVLVDAKARIGEQPHCGEFVPRQLFEEFSLNKDSVIQRVERMETRVLRSLDDLGKSPDAFSRKDDGPTSGTNSIASSEDEGSDGTVLSETGLSPGYLIDRVRFDRDLAAEAAAKGALVISSARVVRREPDGWVVRCRGRETLVRAKIVIASDGVSSTVAGCMGLRPPKVLRGVQVEAPLARSLDSTYVFLDRSLILGYGWLFPKGKVGNIGLGVATGADISPANLLEQLLKRLHDLGLIQPGILARSSGLIPVSGIRENLVVENVLLCGDAGGLTHPITGAGIAQAVFSGQEAGIAAVDSLKSHEPKDLQQYEKEVKGRYLGVAEHALSKRELMMTRWNDRDFSQICMQTWIGFKGYRRRVR
jgi:digeranylgeranylglycerophospholipid reductase